MTKIRKTDLYLTQIQNRDELNRQFVKVNDNTQEIRNILRTLKLHEEGHQANDLTPQFKALCEKVEALKQNEPFWNANRRIPEIMSRIEGLETAHNCQVSTNEEIFDKLRAVHTCHNHAALQEDRKRIVELEKYQTQLNASENIARICVRLNVLEEVNSGLWEKVTEHDEGITSMLKSIPDIEILKTQVAGMQEQIKGLENRLSRAQDMIAEMHKDGFIPVKIDYERRCEGCKHKIVRGDEKPCSECAGRPNHPLFEPIPPRKPKEKKTCSNCGGWNDSPLNTRCDQCINGSLWKPKAKPAGRPKKPVKAGKVQ